MAIWTLIWDDGPEDLLVALSGAANNDDFQACTRAIVSDPRFRAGMAIVVDFSGADLSALTTDDVHDRLDRLQKFASILAGSTVISVASEPAGYGIIRMQNSLSPDLDVDRRVFHTLDEARAWLGRSVGARLG